ncbi:TPA: hypothetical protein ACSP2W_003759 [Aeromonas veronii]
MRSQHFAHFYKIFGTVRSIFGAPALMDGIGRGFDIDANNPNVLKRGRGLVIAYMSAAGVIDLVVPRSKSRPMKGCADLGMCARQAYGKV